MFIPLNPSPFSAYPATASSPWPGGRTVTNSHRQVTCSPLPLLSIASLPRDPRPGTCKRPNRWFHPCRRRSRPQKRLHSQRLCPPSGAAGKMAPAHRRRHQEPRQAAHPADPLLFQRPRWQRCCSGHIFHCCHRAAPWSVERLAALPRQER